ncbi:MAG: hypothetical protein ACYCYO_05525 [Bacilli bacterium]
MPAAQMLTGTASLQVTAAVNPDANGSGATAYFDDLMLVPYNALSAIQYSDHGGCGGWLQRKDKPVYAGEAIHVYRPRIYSQRQFKRILDHEPTYWGMFQYGHIETAGVHQTII